MLEYCFLTPGQVISQEKVRAPALMHIAFKVIIVYNENDQLGLEKPQFVSFQKSKKVLLAV